MTWIGKLAEVIRKRPRPAKFVLQRVKNAPGRVRAELEDLRRLVKR